jgi:hypothetical protein
LLHALGVALGVLERSLVKLSDARRHGDGWVGVLRLLGGRSPLLVDLLLELLLVEELLRK